MELTFSRFFRVLGAAALLVTACTPAVAPSAVSNATLHGTDGRDHPLLDPNAKLTVVEFFSAHCPCQSQHDERLRAIAQEYAARGVVLAAIDSEAEGTLERDRSEAAERHYTFPILLDADSAIARKLGADYATFTLLVDHSGNVLYFGGIDSDKSHLTDDATFYLRDAIDDALAGRAVRRPQSKALGCALTLR